MVRGHAPGNDAGCFERAGRGTAWRRLGRAGPHGQSQQLVTAATWDRRIHVQRSLASANAGKRRERGTSVPGERLHDLRGGPRSGEVLGDVAMHHAALLRRENQARTAPGTSQGDHKDLEGNHLLQRIFHQCLPGRGRRLPWSHAILLPRGCDHVHAQRAAFPHDPRRTPRQIGA